MLYIYICYIYIYTYIIYIYIYTIWKPYERKIDKSLQTRTTQLLAGYHVAEDSAT